MPPRLLTALILATTTLLPVPAGAQDREPDGGASSLDSPASEPRPQEQEARFFSAAGELLLLNGGLWSFNRYVTKEEYAVISPATIKANLKSGFHFDHDNFTINQSGHPYQGSLMFAAARSNGYGFWESGAFTLVGSALWECCLENSRPSINDLVNTTLGGMTRGEISHRLATMLRNNMAEGGGRLWRELGAAVIDPVSGFTRLVHGEIASTGPNPDGRLPSRFELDTDVGYRQVGGLQPNQRIVSLNGSYGDPFGDGLGHPFDSFWVGIDVNSSGPAAISRMEERGILAGWPIGGPSEAARHVFGLTQEYQYFNNASQVFGAEIFGATLLSRYRFGPGLEAVTDLGAMVYPLAGIRTTDFENPETGRNYDYATGGGLRVAGRLSRRGREIAMSEYRLSSAHTDNGTSDHNTLQFFNATLRVPLAGPVGAGAGYSWYSRQTTYSRFTEARQTQREWRVFVDLALSRRRDKRP
jgi:hypothetical protein